MYIIYSSRRKKIKIDIDHLVNIRKTFDELLGDEIKEHIKKEKTSYKEYSFTRNEKLIYEYVQKHPGIIKKGVIDAFGSGVEFEGHKVTLSPVTVFKTIEKLEKEKIIEVREDENNSQVHHLFINNENVLVSLIRDLEHFKQAYFKLLDESKRVLKDIVYTIEGIDVTWEILDAIIMPYKNLIIMGITSDLIINWKQPIDKEILAKRFSIFFSAVREIHQRLYGILPNMIGRHDNLEVLPSIIYSNSEGLHINTMLKMLIVFEKCGLSESAEIVLDWLWKIHYPILPIINTYFSYINENDLKDWRNVINEMGRCYEPKTKQDPLLYY